MKKFLRLFLTLVLFSSIFILIACDGSNSNGLVGTWNLINYQVSITFNDDGTGVEIENGVEMIFEWSTEDGMLTRNLMKVIDGEPGVLVQNWSYSIRVNILQLRDEEAYPYGFFYFVRAD